MLPFWYMGLFSSDKKITVQSSSVQLSEEFEDLLTQSVLNSIRTEEPIVGDLLTNSINGVGSRSRSLLNYAREHFRYHLPNGTVDFTQASDTAIQSVLQSITGKLVHVRLNVHEECNPSMWGEEFLLANRGWDRDTNIVTYFEEPVEYIGAEAIANDQIEIFYSDDTSEVVDTISPMNKDANYYHVIYSFRTGLEIDKAIHYWFYDSASDEYSVLTAEAGEVMDTSFYPVVPFRLNNADLIQGDYESEVKKMLNFISVPVKQLNDSINENPDISEIDDAYLVFAVHLQTETQHGMRYLHEFFSQAHDRSRIGYDEYLANKQTVPQYNTFNFSDTNLQWTISYLYTRKYTEARKIGRKGFVEKQYIPSGTYDIGSGMTYTDARMVWAKQISDSEVEVVEVSGLQFWSHIYGGKSVGCNLDESRVEDNSTFLIPVSREIGRNIGLFQFDNLIKESVRMVFNSWQETKIKWYQKGIFKAVFLIVAVVLAAYGFVNALQGYLAMGATLTTALVTVVMETVVLGVVIQLGIQLLGKVLPPELAAVFAIVALAMGVSGNINMNTAMWASTQMSSVAEVAINYDLKEIMSKLEDFTATMEEQEEELQKLEDQLNDIDTGLVENLLYEDTSLTVRPELPEMFFQRTLELPNNMYSMYDYIENFRAEATAAPDFYELMSIPTNSRRI